MRSNIDSFFPDKKVGESSKKLWLQETIARSYPAWYQSPKINISLIVLPPLRTASNYHSRFHNQVMQSTYLCLSGSRKCVLFGKFGILCFLTPPFWDSPLCFATENRVLNFDSNIWLTSVQVHEEQYENIKNMQIVLVEQKSITSFEAIWNLPEKCFSCSSF